MRYLLLILTLAVLVGTGYFYDETRNRLSNITGNLTGMVGRTTSTIQKEIGDAEEKLETMRQELVTYQTLKHEFVEQAVGDLLERQVAEEKTALDNNPNERVKASSALNSLSTQRTQLRRQILEVRRSHEQELKKSATEKTENLEKLETLIRNKRRELADRQRRESSSGYSSAIRVRHQQEQKQLEAELATYVHAINMENEEIDDVVENQIKNYEEYEQEKISKHNQLNTQMKQNGLIDTSSPDIPMTKSEAVNYLMEHDGEFNKKVDELTKAEAALNEAIPRHEAELDKMMTDYHEMERASRESFLQREESNHKELNHKELNHILLYGGGGAFVLGLLTLLSLIRARKVS